MVAQNYQFTFSRAAINLLLGAEPAAASSRAQSVVIEDTDSASNCQSVISDAELDGTSLPDLDESFSLTSTTSASDSAFSSQSRSSSPASASALSTKTPSRLSRLLRSISPSLHLSRTPSPALSPSRKSQKRAADDMKSPRLAPIPVAKKAKVIGMSAIAKAIRGSNADESKSEGSKPKPAGLMKYFSKCTQEEYNEQMQKLTEHDAITAEADAERAEAAKRANEEKTREDARLRKQKERARKRENEISSGERTFSGIKRKVCNWCDLRDSILIILLAHEH